MEAIVARVLGKYFKVLLNDWSRKDFSLSFLKGETEMRNLEMNTELLQSLLSELLPNFVVIYAHCARVHVQLPGLTKLRSRPTIIKVEDVDIQIQEAQKMMVSSGLAMKLATSGKARREYSAKRAKEKKAKPPAVDGERTWGPDRSVLEIFRLNSASLPLDTTGSDPTKSGGSTGSRRKRGSSRRARKAKDEGVLDGPIQLEKEDLPGDGEHDEDEARASGSSSRSRLSWRRKSGSKTRGKKSPSVPEPPAGTAHIKKKYTLQDKIVDGVRIEVTKIRLTQQCLGKHKTPMVGPWTPPVLITDVRDVVFVQTTENWEVPEDLAEARLLSKEGPDVYVFKKATGTVDIYVGVIDWTAFGFADAKSPVPGTTKKDASAKPAQPEIPPLYKGFRRPRKSIAGYKHFLLPVVRDAKYEAKITLQRRTASEIFGIQCDMTFDPVVTEVDASTVGWFWLAYEGWSDAFARIDMYPRFWDDIDPASVAATATQNVEEVRGPGGDLKRLKVTSKPELGPRILRQLMMNIMLPSATLVVTPTAEGDDGPDQQPLMAEGLSDTALEVFIDRFEMTIVAPNPAERLFVPDERWLAQNEVFMFPQVNAFRLTDLVSGTVLAEGGFEEARSVFTLPHSIHPLESGGDLDAPLEENIVYKTKFGAKSQKGLQELAAGSRVTTHFRDNPPPNRWLQLKFTKRFENRPFPVGWAIEGRVNPTRANLDLVAEHGGLVGRLVEFGSVVQDWMRSNPRPVPPSKLVYQFDTSEHTMPPILLDVQILRPTLTLLTVGKRTTAGINKLTAVSIPTTSVDPHSPLSLQASVSGISMISTKRESAIPPPRPGTEVGKLIAALRTAPKTMRASSEKVKDGKNAASPPSASKSGALSTLKGALNPDAAWEGVTFDVPPPNDGFNPLRSLLDAGVEMDMFSVGVDATYRAGVAKESPPGLDVVMTLQPICGTLAGIDYKLKFLPKIAGFDALGKFTRVPESRVVDASGGNSGGETGSRSKSKKKGLRPRAGNIIGGVDGQSEALAKAQTVQRLAEIWQSSSLYGAAIREAMGHLSAELRTATDNVNASGDPETAGSLRSAVEHAADVSHKVTDLMLNLAQSEAETEALRKELLAKEAEKKEMMKELEELRAAVKGSGGGDDHAKQ